jgi:hypothetical protein
MCQIGPKNASSHASMAETPGCRPLITQESSMIFLSTCRLAGLAAILGLSLNAYADSFTSSASSAGSASSGSVSASLRGSSNSSTGGEKTADGDYRITEVAAAPDRAGTARVTMQAEDPQQ